MPPRTAGKPDAPIYVLDQSAGADALHGTEWLLTNGRSGFAMGTASGMPTRRYHGLMISDTSRSPRRVVYVNAIEEELLVEDARGRRVEALSNFCFRGGDGSDVCHPDGVTRLVRFEKGVACTWEYKVCGATVTRRVAMARDRRAAVVHYEVAPEGDATLELRVRPLVSLRDFHGVLRRDETARQFEVTRTSRGCEVAREDGSARVSLESEGAAFEQGEQWWHNFVYTAERVRGLSCVEDLFSPGEFVLTPSGRRRRLEGTLWMGPEGVDGCPSLAEIEAAERARRRVFAAAAVARAGESVAPKDAAVIRRLAWAADDFVFARTPSGGEPCTSIIAGYPWFGEWGRDSMISLSGLLQVTGRHDEAFGVLRRFAGAVRGGIVPNRFGDETGEPLYNTVDASLWFIVACWRLARETRERRRVVSELLPVCLQIVEEYRRGTEYAIAMDPEDSLIAAGSEATQLTWMDAMRDGVVFTPRHGKAVEVNALWYAALMMLAELTAKVDKVRSADLRALAETAGTNFRSRFWNTQRECCHDVLTHDGKMWRAAAELRPNQIFAASLPFSPLTASQRESLVRTVRERLWTPMGVRTLDPSDPGYRARFRGSLPQLDAAYHNGTAWPWLLGPLAEAVMRVGGFSAGSCAEAKGLLEPIAGTLGRWCLGQLAEVYDAEGTPEEPQRPGGCPAQAWSVAEVLRAWVMAQTGS